MIDPYFQVEYRQNNYIDTLFSVLFLESLVEILFLCLKKEMLSYILQKAFDEEDALTKSNQKQ